MIYSRKLGFAPIIIILAILVVASLGVGSYYVVRQGRVVPEKSHTDTQSIKFENQNQLNQPTTTDQKTEQLVKPTSQSKDNRQSSVDDCLKKQGQGLQSDCLYRLAETQRDEFFCEKTPSLYWKDLCFKHVAAFKPLEAISLCDRMIQAGDSKQQCYDAAYSNLAVEKGDVNLCEKAGGYKSACYLRVAEKLNDVSICDRENDSQEKEDCYEDFYFSKAGEDNNMALCEKMSEQSKKDTCYVSVAQNNMNVAACYQIKQYTFVKELCIKSVNDDIANCAKEGESTAPLSPNTSMRKCCPGLVSPTSSIIFSKPGVCQKSQ